jgi:hypothetical protein
MGKQTFVSKATEFFSKLDTRTMFVTLHKYCNNFNEVATHSILWHVNYKKSVERSAAIIRNYIPRIEDTIGRPFTVTHLWVARQELLDSFQDTLVLGVGNNPRDTVSHAYDKILDSKGNVVHGVKIHRKNDEVHLTALFRINKIVHCQGEYPSGNNSSPIVLAKRWLKQKTPVAKWGQYVLSRGRFDQMVAMHQTIVEQDCIRTLN